MNDHLNLEPLEADDPWGYRRDLKDALKKDASEFAVWSYAHCMVTEVPISEQMKENVTKHLQGALPYIQEVLSGVNRSVKNFRKRFDQLKNDEDEEWRKHNRLNDILEKRTLFALFESLYGEKIKEQVQKFDDDLKLVSDLLQLQYGYEYIFMKEWKSSMKKLGVNAWWLELQLA